MAKYIKPGRPAARRAAELLDLPPDTLLSQPRIELWGNCEIHVDGCRRITSYSSQVIGLGCGSVGITISGCGLELTYLGGSSLAVKGVIASVTFTGGGRGGSV